MGQAPIWAQAMAPIAPSTNTAPTMASAPATSGTIQSESSTSQSMPPPTAQPIHVVILTSLSCPHCSKTADETKSMIDKLVQQGRITAEWVDFPNDLATLIATKLTYAFGEQRRYEMYRHFLHLQQEWHTKEWREKLTSIAMSLGIPQEKIDDAFSEHSPEEEQIIERLNLILKNPHFKIDYVPVLIVSDRYLLEDVNGDTLEKKLIQIEKNGI